MMFNPEWKQFEDKMRTGSASEQSQAGDAFFETREKEMQNSKRARDWELGRKAEWARNKPEYVKKRVENEQNKIKEAFLSLKKLGAFKSLIPAPGYILVAPDVGEEEAKTSSGILIPTQKKEPNTGYVIEVGGGIRTPKGAPIECPVQKGDHILYKLGAGAYAIIDGADCRLMMFSDVLATIDD